MEELYVWSWLSALFALDFKLPAPSSQVQVRYISFLLASILLSLFLWNCGCRCTCSTDINTKTLTQAHVWTHLTQSLALCAACVNKQMWTISWSESLGIVWSSYVKRDIVTFEKGKIHLFKLINICLIESTQWFCCNSHAWSGLSSSSCTLFYPLLGITETEITETVHWSYDSSIGSTVGFTHPVR